MAFDDLGLMKADQVANLTRDIYKADNPLVKINITNDTAITMWTYKNGKQDSVKYDFNRGDTFYIVGRDQSNTNEFLVKIGNRYGFMTIPGAADATTNGLGSSANALLTNVDNVAFDAGIYGDRQVDYASLFNKLNEDANNSLEATKYASVTTENTDGITYEETDLISANYSHEIVVAPGEMDITERQTVYEAVVRSHGIPPQWTKYVDPRMVRFQMSDSPQLESALSSGLTSGSSRSWSAVTGLGRRYASVIISNPTVIEIAPGYIQYSNWLNSADLSSAIDDFTAAGNEPGAASTLVAAFSDKESTFYTIKPCFTGENTISSGITRPGYIYYVNALMRIAAIFISRTKSSNTQAEETVYCSTGTTKTVPEPIGLRLVPRYGNGDNSSASGGAVKYNNVDWTGFNKPSGYIHLQIGGIVLNAASTGAAGSSDRFDYIKFYLTGSTTADDQFETNIEESMLGNIANTINSALKEAAYWTSGESTSGWLTDIIAGAEDVFNSNTLNGVNPLAGVFNISEMIGGAKIVFPKIITESSYGKSIQCECSFAAIYGDQESIYLNSIMPYLHLLAFVLPHQVKTSLEMYTFPFIVKAYCRGLFNVEMGVVSNFSVSRGGNDNALWSFNGTAELINVSFTVTPLITNLTMTPETAGLGWILKNKGLQEYLSAITAFDARNDKYDLALDIAASWMTSSMVAKFRNIFETFTTSSIMSTATTIANTFAQNDNSFYGLASNATDKFDAAFNDLKKMFSF